MCNSLFSSKSPSSGQHFFSHVLRPRHQDHHLPCHMVGGFVAAQCQVEKKKTSCLTGKDRYLDGCIDSKNSIKRTTPSPLCHFSTELMKQYGVSSLKNIYVSDPSVRNVSMDASVPCHEGPAPEPPATAKKEYDQTCIIS